MNYRVIWRPGLTDRLHFHAFIAFEMGRDPGPLIQASAEVTRRLADRPAEEGESRTDRERVLIVHPLSVTYEVFETAGVVMVYAAVVYPRQRA